MMEVSKNIEERNMVEIGGIVEEENNVVDDNSNNNDIINENKKFTDGVVARDKWSKPIVTDNLLSMEDFNKECNNVFIKGADIVLDNTNRQTVIQTIPVNNKLWSENIEQIYTIVKDGKIIKIGGTRNGMKNRWGSYLCGHHVLERGKSGKMSVTNAHLYHSIEKDLLETESKYEFYTWTLPIVEHTINILGEETKVVSQTYHAYESCCIKKYKSITGIIPIMCDNSDPTYK